MTVRGERVFLRDMIAGDIADYKHWLTAETEWQKWDAPWEKWTAKDVNDYLAWRMELLNRPLQPVRSRFEICTLLGTHIGWVTSYPMGGDRRRPAVGIDIPDPAQRGKGYGREAFTLFTEYIAGHYPGSNVFCQTWSGNAAMCALAESAGFILWEVGKGARVVNGVPFDALTFVYRSFKDEPNL